MAQGKIRPIKIPILQAMVEGTIQQFFTDNILVENQIGYDDALKEMIHIIISGIKA